MNPDFFKGTVVEDDVDKLLEELGMPTSRDGTVESAAAE